MSENNTVALNLFLPSNPRYQPQSLVPFFGYDHLCQPNIRVEIAGMKALYKIGIMPEEDFRLLTPEVEKRLLSEITTTMVDKREKITKHDIRALVQLMMEILPPPLRRWLHMFFTSYDVIHTGAMLAYREAFDFAVRPALGKLVEAWADKISEFAGTVQIGRTHGQHAIPITVGFWLHTILRRILDVSKSLIDSKGELRGKISGAVGAYNAQVLFDAYKSPNGKTFEKLVLAELELEPSPVSTQILPPEPLSRFLHNFVLLSAALANFGRDCRHLQRTEISEIATKFKKGQVGSSTMAHKRNPIIFENCEGMFYNTKNEYGKVLDTLISEHQRDLVGSSLMRQFPAVMIYPQVQIEKMTKVFEDLIVDRAALERNFNMSKNLITGEAIYIALQRYGYEKDAHELVNHTLTPNAQQNGTSLAAELEKLCEGDEELRDVWRIVPSKVKDVLTEHPERYIGLSVELAKATVFEAKNFIANHLA